MAAVKFSIELTVDSSRIDEFKRLAKEMNTIVRCNEPHRIQCQWFFREGDNKWYLTEMFADSDAFLMHLEEAGYKLQEIFEVAEVSRFEVFGELSLSAKAVIASFGVKYFTPWDGVTRETGVLA